MMKTPLLVIFLSSSIAVNGATILGDNWDDIGAGFTNGKPNGLGTGNNAAKTAAVVVALASSTCLDPFPELARNSPPMPA